MEQLKLNPMGIMATIREHYGPIADTDSYKMSQPPQYPKNAKRMISYISSRGGKYDHTLFIGAQMLVMEHFMQPLTHIMVDNLIKFEKAHFMDNYTDDLEIGLRTVVDEYDGAFPIRIRAAKEGMIIPVGNILISVESTVDDHRVFSLVSYFETKLVRVWSPTTVATESYNIRKLIYQELKKTSIDPDSQIPFKLIDFGARAVSSDASAAFAGVGHLAVFQGSDTVVATLAANIAYNASMSSFGIPASEHSTTTMHGRHGEEQLVEQMFDAYAKPGCRFATVIDSYDWRKFISDIAPKFKQRLIDSEAHWVFRPDSGDAVLTPVQVVRDLADVFGYSTNNKGYRVLNNVSVLQGDGIDSVDVDAILRILVGGGWSVDNIAFGMGGGLLQKNHRDTMKFAMKCCAVLIDDKWEEVYKDPAVYNVATWEVKKSQSSFKKSKGGRLELIYNTQTGEYRTLPLENAELTIGLWGWEYALHTIYENGKLCNMITLDEIRKNAGVI